MKRFLKNRYEILSVIGRGGMGCVYKVADRQRGGKVLAAKELRVGNLAAAKLDDAVSQFRGEAMILTRLSHPNIPRIYEYFLLRGSYYIIMEYIEGRTLEQVLAEQKGRPVDEPTGLSWALQICRAMRFLSVQKPRPIVFRDLKPSNIMITGDGKVKLIDFGIARFFKDDKIEDTFVYGTPGYAAPEQYGAGQTDVRADIFSLGATLHHALTGRSPSLSPLDFPEPRLLNPDLSRQTSAIIKKALEPHREKRFQSALEMKLAVQKVLLARTAPMRGAKKVIYAKPGKPITLPWWRKTSLVSVPVMTLGLSGTAGTLSTADRWLKPKPRSYGPDAARFLFQVDGGMLKTGHEYRPVLTAKTDAGIVRSRLSIRKSWPWALIDAVLIAAVLLLVHLLK